MTYKHTLEYIYSQLPMYQRVGVAAYKANLDNTYKIINLINNPQNNFKSIHVAGTNGKGSTSHMLASILQHAGYRVGLYTSPHLKDFRERIKINGKKISKNYVVDFIKKYRSDFEEIKPSFFEMTVGLAFDYFSVKKIDIAIIEVGLGGRLDSTNVITPLVSVITNIGWDHMNLLGNSLQKIAAEKAGIIKPNIPIVISETQVEVKNIFVKKAKEQKAPIFFADQEIKIESVKKSNNKLKIKLRTPNSQLPTISLDLTGSYQTKNISGVLKTIEILNRENKFKISNSAVSKGLKQVQKTTGLMGRWQTLSKKPLIICDTGHNKDGIKEVLKNIAATPHSKLHFVFGMVNDKDISDILLLLPKNAIYYFCKANIPRGMEAKELMEKGNKIGLRGNDYKSVKQALKAAKSAASNTDLVFVGGSTFTVAEVV
jgi:dihydrofolate synthase/folylpolyglutamate synthase